MKNFKCPAAAAAITFAAGSGAGSKSGNEHPTCMKTKLAILMAVVLFGGGLKSFAQNNPAPAADNQPPPPALTPASIEAPALTLAAAPVAGNPAEPAAKP